MSRGFVLGTGRCGTTTFARACAHLSSHTVGHESQAARYTDRLVYPVWHVEIDNRLSWHLGGLDERYGDEPVFVHLTRDPNAVAASYARRYAIRAGIMPAFASGIVRNTRLPTTDRARMQAARLMVDTITENVDLFLRDKTKVVHVDIDDPIAGFDRFVELLGADGDLQAAHQELDRVNNASRRS